MMILYFLERHIPPLIPFAIINNTSMSINSSNFTLFYVNPWANGNLEGSNSQIPKHIFLKFSKSSATNNVSFLGYKS